MKNGHARRLPAAFRAALACGGVSEGVDVGAGEENSGGQAENLVGEKWKIGGRGPCVWSNLRIGHGVWPRKTARGANDGNQMQTLRIEHDRTRMPVWAERIA